MYRLFLFRLLATLAFFFFGCAASALFADGLSQNPDAGSHRAGQGQPFGTRNDAAAEQLEEFDFLIGYFSRRERRRDPSSGEWSDWGSGVKVGSWITGGSAILDEHINHTTGEAVVFIRTFDVSGNVWHHLRVSMPNFRLTEAEGQFKGAEYFNDSEFTDAQGNSVLQQYIFYDITPVGYKWRAQRTINGQTFTYWEIEYNRLDQAPPAYFEQLLETNPANADTGPAYGSINPAAPAELEQFGFMVGDFSRQERKRGTDGLWGDWQQGEWNARYLRNGFGIIDESINHESGVITSNLRIFDPADQQWIVIWQKFPDFSTLRAEGGMVGDQMIIVPEGADHQYIFSEMTPERYLWTLKVPYNGDHIPVWEIICNRRNDP